MIHESGFGQGSWPTRDDRADLFVARREMLCAINTFYGVTLYEKNNGLISYGIMPLPVSGFHLM